MSYLHEEIYTPLTGDVVDQILFDVAAAIDRAIGGMGFDPIPEPIQDMVNDLELILGSLRDHQVMPPR